MKKIERDWDKVGVHGSLIYVRIKKWKKDVLFLGEKIAQGEKTRNITRDMGLSLIKGKHKIKKVTKKRVPLGQHITIKKPVPLGQNITIKKRVPLGQHTSIKKRVPLGQNITIKKRVPLGQNTSIKKRVPLGQNITIKKRVPLGQRVHLKNKKKKETRKTQRIIY